MSLYDELTAPGREVEAQLRLALKGSKPACRRVLDSLPALLVAEERWVLSELGKCGAEDIEGHLARHVEAHDRLRAVLEQMCHPGRADADTAALLRILDAMLQSHLRDERSLYEAACTQGWLTPSSPIARFARRAGSHAANLPDYRLLG